MICPRKKRPIKDEDFSAIVVPSMRGHGYLDYTVESHPSRAMQVMDEFRHHELLCDLVLHVTYKDKIVDFKVRVIEVIGAFSFGVKKLFFFRKIDVIYFCSAILLFRVLRGFMILCTIFFPFKFNFSINACSCVANATKVTKCDQIPMKNILKNQLFWSVTEEAERISK